jgi:hypothetical protein
MARGRCEFVDSRLRRYPPDRASARSPMDKPGKTPCVSPRLPTGRRLPTSFTAPQQHQGLILIPGKVQPSAGAQPLAYFSRKLSRQPGPPHHAASEASVVRLRPYATNDVIEVLYRSPPFGGRNTRVPTDPLGATIPGARSGRVIVAESIFRVLI